MATLHRHTNISGKIKRSPAFVRTRENMQEFGRVCKGNKLLRLAFREELRRIPNRGLIGRLTKEFMKIIRTDVVNNRGNRVLNNGDFSTLKGFEFNDQYQLGGILRTAFKTGIDLNEGRAWVEIPPFIPNEVIASSCHPINCKLVSAVAEIDFEQGIFNVARNASDIIELDINQTPLIQLSQLFTPDSDVAVFLVFGIQFFHKSGNEMYPLTSGAALQLVAVCNE